jgi:type IX secretion system substrate protein/beta-propeller repeat-containing protein
MNKLCCLIGMFITCRVCSGQTPDWEWARSAACNDTSGFSEGWNVASDDLGNVYVTGFFGDSSISFGSVTLYNPNPNSYNIYVTKYDSEGNVLWAKNAGGTGSGLAYGISTDGSGNVYVTGYFNDGFISFDTIVINNTGGSATIFLAKYDSSGNVAWAKSAVGSAISYAVKSDKFGNIYITGVFDSLTLTFNSYVLTNSGSYDSFIAKYDSSGNILWASRAGGTGDDESYSVTSDLFGNAYITGYFTSSSIIFNSDTLNALGSGDFFLAKYDSSGNVLWGKRAGGANQDIGQSVSTNASGDVYVTGYFNSQSIIFGMDTLFHPAFDFFVKYDASGNVLMAKSFTGGIPYNIVLDSMDNVYMIGAMISPFTFDTITLQVPLGSTDPIFIIKCDSLGHALWAKTLASGGDDNSDIALGANGSIYIGGDFYKVNPFIIGNDTLILIGEENVFVAKLSYSSSQSVSEIISIGEYTLYPNPFLNSVSIKSSDNEQSQIILYDITSRKILNQSFINSTSINTEQLAKGIYLYEVRNKNGVIKKGKIVKD